MESIYMIIHMYNIFNGFEHIVMLTRTLGRPISVKKSLLWVGQPIEQNPVILEGANMCSEHVHIYIPQFRVFL